MKALHFRSILGSGSLVLTALPTVLSVNLEMGEASWETLDPISHSITQARGQEAEVSRLSGHLRSGLMCLHTLILSSHNSQPLQD